MAKDAYYFSHDSNARFDPKLIKIQTKYGLEGYGLYFFILEILRDETDYRFELKETEAISFQSRKEPAFINDFLEFCYKIELFEKDNKFFWSKRLLRSMEEYKSFIGKQRDNGIKGGRPKKENNPTETQNKPNGFENDNPTETQSKAINKTNKIHEIKETKTKHEFCKFVSSCFSLDFSEVEKFFEKLLKTYDEKLIFEAAGKIDTSKEVSNPLGYITGIVRNLKNKPADKKDGFLGEYSDFY